MYKGYFLSLFLFIFLLVNPCVRSQDIEFQKWLEKDQEEYTKFIEQEDKEFAEFLKKDWQNFLTQQGIKPFKKPKPVKIPVAKVKKQPEYKIPTKKIEKLPPPPPKPSFTPKPKPQPKPTKQTIVFNFYGAQLQLPRFEAKVLDLSSPLTPQKISQAWLTMAATSYKPLLQTIREYQKQLKLNDWALLILINDLLHQSYSDLNKNMRTAYEWFFLIKLGYDARVAFKSDQLYLLLPAKNTIFEQPFVKINNQRFYFISIGAPLKLSGKIRTYQGHFKNAEGSLNLMLQNLPIYTLKPSVKKVTFKYKGQQYKLKAQYDVQVVQFMKNYPHTDLDVYFRAPASGELNYSLLSQLRELIKDKSEVEAVNLLLRFVQTAFNYQTDDQQFGYEKCLLPDETFYYHSSDCEDRSILFAYLVRKLLGLNVIALDYPNHIATAVQFTSKVPGAAVVFNGNYYVICDPTYVNANAGMVMPEFKNVNPKIIPIQQ